MYELILLTYKERAKAENLFLFSWVVGILYVSVWWSYFAFLPREDMLARRESEGTRKQTGRVGNKKLKAIKLWVFFSG